MLKVHEMSKAWPAPTADRFAAIKQSIAELGLLQPMIAWTDPKEQEWCVDGGTRQDAIAELLKDGITVAKNGKPIEPKWEHLDGTEGEVLEVVKAMNGADRRHMKPSQLAMTDVFNYELEVKYAKRAGVEIENPEGELATVRSQRGGYNRTYWFQCRRIKNANKELAVKVRDGVLTIPQALDELAKLNGQAVPTFDGAPAPDAPVMDGLRNVVEGPYREIMAERDRFKALRGSLLKAVKEFKALAESKAGVGLEGAEALALRDIAQLVDQATPFAVCPVCDGAKKVGGIKCVTCTHGFVTKAGWKEVPAEFKVAGVAED